MAITPEGKVKALIKKLLDEYKPNLYGYMPVPSGYGEPTLDYLCCYKGEAFAIEAKAPGKEPTSRQDATIERMTEAGMRVFVVTGGETLDADLEQLRMWLELRKG